MAAPTVAPPDDLEIEEAPPSPLDAVRRFRHALAPFPRAGLFYIRSWSNWLQHRGDDGVPAPLPSRFITKS